LVFLGRDGDDVYASLLAPLSEEHPLQGQLEWHSLRTVGARLSDLDAGLATSALALQNWHRTHTHCPRCGEPTFVTTAGWVRQCPRDGSEHYPRTDGAVIVAIVDDADRLLLARQAVWQPGHFSIVAGFVEPGETFEAAVAREAFEEVGIRVDDVTYLGSQPWPFPASLMIGCTARALTTEIVADGTEIEEARWFSREELTQACASRELLLPSRVSIARRIIEHWFGAELPNEWSRP
jgi:NAD+ diphosphatase